MRTLRALTAMVVAVGMVAVPRYAQAQVESEPGSCDRSLVVAAWQGGGSQVHAVAEQALLGTEADVCAFLATGWDQRATVDDRLAVNQMMAAGGPAVRTAAQSALDSSDPAALGAFLTTGWQQPAQNDQRVRVNQMMAAGGAQLRAAAQQALDSTTPGALEEFVNSGWQQPHTTDLRLRVNQIMAAGGPQVRTLAQRALDIGTSEALNRFIDVDWEVAAARDQEVQTLTDLVQAAEVAGARAASETQAAKAEADRAVAEAAAARRAAEVARDATEAAQNNAAQAADAAKRAAQAADRAAAAAQQAVGAARAASAAARVAAGAATRAAAAATRAGQAAAQAYNSAALAATDAKHAAAARQAAQYARQIAAGAKRSADAADAAGQAAHQAGEAAIAAGSAADNAAASAQAALDAGDYAARAGADASAARAAAARASANADRANRAAQAAVAFANTAATAAFQSRDAANRAVANANAAAAAADDAAAHAGEAAQAAARATAHANAATAAALEALAAAGRAKTVYDAAREADAERLRTTFEESRQVAIAAAAEAARLENQVGWDTAEAAKRSAQTNQLIAKAIDPATPQAEAVRAARQAALALAGADGSWTRTAALSALAGSDPVALEFVRTGVAVAAGQDDRSMLQVLMTTGSDAMKAAAQAALDGSDADVAAFLRSGDYPGRDTEDRVKVNQILATARAAGDVVTVDHAQRALDAGTGQAYRQFLEDGQYTAEATDRRVKTNQILADPNSGPELKAAAQVALDGPPGMLKQFLDVGRHQAAQRDQDTAAHNAAVSALLSKATAVATTAMQNALQAQFTAANARNEAAKATEYAQQAQNSAEEAAGYAQAAVRSADDAQASADRAAASARTALAAAASADASARRAARSAILAQASATHAADYAAQAYASAVRAYHAAVAADNDAKAAVAAYNGAIAEARDLAEIEQGEWIVSMLNECDFTFPNGSPAEDECAARVARIVDNPFAVALENGGVCQQIFPEGSGGYKNCLKDVLSPNFQWHQTLTIVSAMVSVGQAFAATLLVGETLVLASAAIAACTGICMGIMEALTPILAPELVGLPTLGLAAGGFSSVMVAARLGALLERGTVELRGGDAALARMLGAVKKMCFVPGNSFTPGTRVRLTDGTSRSIQDIRVGDRVLSTDPVAGTTDTQPVTAVITGSGTKRLVDITIDTDGRSGDATAEVTATEGHPFWVADPGQWIDAGKLRAGQWLRTGTGTWVQITRTRHHTDTATVHNFTVAQHHTYYVVADDTSVLVHNSGCDPVVLKAIEIRASGQVRKERNIAVMRTEIGGLDSSRLWVGASGQATRPGHVPQIGPDNPQIFVPWQFGKIRRDTDPEYRILNLLANELGQNPTLTGKVVLFSELPTCTSCNFVIGQFKARYPNIEVVVIPITGVL